MADPDASTLACTPRLVLRPWRVEEVSRFYDLYRQPDVVRWLGGRMMEDEEESLQTIERGAKRLLADPRFGSWAVVERASGVAAGTVLLKALPDGAGEIEIGWHLHPDSWGRGIATEAARALLDRAVSYDLDEVWGVVHPDNRRSVRVCEKIGLRLLGVTTHWYHEPSLMFWTGVNRDVPSVTPEQPA